MKNSCRGFTLTELLIVMVIMAILAGIAIPRYLSQSEKAVAAEAFQMIGTLKRAEFRFNDEHPGTWHAFADACADATLSDNLGVDLSDACGDAARWTYSVTANVDGTATITATRTDDDHAGTIFMIVGGDGSTWQGTGAFLTDGPNWPAVN